MRDGHVFCAREGGPSCRTGEMQRSGDKMLLLTVHDQTPKPHTHHVCENNKKNVELEVFVVDDSEQGTTAVRWTKQRCWWPVPLTGEHLLNWARSKHSMCLATLSGGPLPAAHHAQIVNLYRPPFLHISLLSLPPPPPPPTAPPSSAYPSHRRPRQRPSTPTPHT
ncbi:hypothetical protein BC835DRAFT_874626 [Cytidiella melzeri]|nr:hypothetical protein BC835DRAFT_874626 [Cytidiella melzeri]